MATYGEVEPTKSTPQEIRYECANNLAELLERRGISLLISTYQAGRLVVINGVEGQLEIEFHSFEQPMGIAIDAGLNRLAVATRDAIWTAKNEPSIARQLPTPAGTCFLSRSAQITGDIQAHQIAFSDDDLWVVNTRFSCLCTLDDNHSFVPHWRPSFIDTWAADDRCHLNGMALVGGRPKYVTMLGKSNVAEGWRPDKATGGCIVDVETDETLVEGLAMPHSPDVHDGQLYVLDSGRGALLRLTANGETTTLGRFPGFTRGLAMYHDLAIVGLSKIRETSTFGGLPIAEKKRDLKCGFAILNLATGRLESQFEFKTGVEEIFDIAVVAHPGRTTLRGPNAKQDELDTIWVLPQSAREQRDG